MIKSIPATAVSGAVRKQLTELLRPITVKRGDGEYGIGVEIAKENIRESLKATMGTYPWYDPNKEGF